MAYHYQHTVGNLSKIIWQERKLFNVEEKKSWLTFQD